MASKKDRAHRCDSFSGGRALASAALIAALAGAAGAQTTPPGPTLPTPTAGKTTSTTAPGASGAPASAPLSGAKSAAPAASSAPASCTNSSQPRTSATGGSAPRTGSDHKDDGRVHTDDNFVVDLHVNDEDLANVLEMLSIQSQKNIVTSKNVNARVTANLYNVTFYEALDQILHSNGYGYREQGNFINIYTLDELKAIDEAGRVKTHKVIRLNYLNATDAAEFVRPLLSQDGQIKTNGKTTTFPTMGATPVGADDYANEAILVVFDYDDNIAEVESAVKQLDTRPAQVLVEATILQTTLNEANAFGVDFSIISDLNFSEFVGIGGPLQAANALIGGATTKGGSTAFPTDGRGGAVVSNPGNTAGPSTLKLGIVKSDVAAFIRMLDDVTDTTVLSNPKVLALNRMPSRVLVGRKVGYISSTSTDTSTTQTVQFLDTGTQLYFRPFVSSDRMIRMELKPQVSEAQIRDAKDSSGGSVTIPDEITNELVTNVIVGDGQTIVLGGLFRESTSTHRAQVPILGDIPLIGQAFRGNDDSSERNEIIFLITPSIVNDTTLTEQGQRGMDAVDHARTGARAGLLWFSRQKITGMMNLEADRLAKSGQSDKALWKLKQSLWMDSQQPDAIDMRERITGKRDSWPTRSMLDDIIHGETSPRARKSVSNDAPALSPIVVHSPVMPTAANGTNSTTTTTTTTPANTQRGHANEDPSPAAHVDGEPPVMCGEPSVAHNGGRFGGYMRFLSAWSNAAGATTANNTSNTAPSNNTLTGVQEPGSDK